MPAEAIAAYSAYTLPAAGASPTNLSRNRLAQAGQWNPAQLMGRRWPIGCVALEITQRCNLDCTLCYLSEGAESLKDLPLEEIYRRIAAIRSHYGPGTNVQITGGEPTLRRRDELIAIVHRARLAGLRPALFTNGIRATRALLNELRVAGLIDVAFHVDTTQNRGGYATETALNVVREKYIERARGLNLAVYFNTTVHGGNYHDLPVLTEFFVQHCDVVKIASFQLQADTGRSVLGVRDRCISLDTVAEQIRLGARVPLDFDVLKVGHSRCNRYAMTAVANGNVHDLCDEPEFMRWAMENTAYLPLDRVNVGKTLWTLATWALRHPTGLPKCARWLARKLWQMKTDLIGRGRRVHKLSFFIHNFMDSSGLEKERVDACAFMVETADGPMSMCLHNAKRDEVLLKPIPVYKTQRIVFWNPLTGKTSDQIPAGHGLPEKRRRVPKSADAAIRPEVSVL